ncbi:uncharacterized protein BCR38DRAFT_349849 [Pseudomassariella vexata]|uniref:Uncharacterized protein n=1 Tax=Pseudomassariella vexata TaxID=1141098 RepID=A0A1Y2DNQ7_9PEZI|nr:uncharacterized protein BCR38DRAFT_349849 [Pseudomassariella vexata]ORY60880.1 hypothetical protein BCR38DRAFT_349849 [Pseudomassariella vexata]
MDASRQYDPDSGQVFREWTVRPQRLSQNKTGWERQPPNSRKQPKLAGTSALRGSKGPNSLMDMAISVVGENIELVEMETLRYFPDELLWYIWDYLDEPERGFSLHAWKIFASYLPHKKWKHPRKEHWNRGPRGQTFQKKFDNPNAPLSLYTKPLISPYSDFLTRLTISGGASFGVNEMLNIPDLCNLVALEITQPFEATQAAVFPRVSDRVLKEWASTPNVFPNLRFLTIWGRDFTTPKSFQYVSKFSALEVYDVFGSEGDWVRRDDWHPAWKLCKSGSRARLPHVESRPLANIVLGKELTLCEGGIRRVFKRVNEQESQPQSSDSNIDSTVIARKRVSNAEPDESSRIRPKKLRDAKDVFAQFGL